MARLTEVDADRCVISISNVGPVPIQSLSKFLPGVTDVDGVATRAGDQVDEGKSLPFDFGHKEDSYIPVDAGILIVIIMMGVLRAHYICSTLTMLFSLLPGHLEKARSILARLDELVPNLVLVRMARISLERRHGELEKGSELFAQTLEKCAKTEDFNFYSWRYARYLALVSS